MIIKSTYFISSNLVHDTYNFQPISLNPQPTIQGKTIPKIKIPSDITTDIFLMYIDIIIYLLLSHHY